MYQRPIQARAIATESRFLDSVNELLRYKSFAALTVEEIAEHAGLTASAFIKRFGTKKQALLLLWERYCDKASGVMSQIGGNLSQYPGAIDACIAMSEQLEALQTAYFPVNRAMHEDFQENLKVHPLTKKIYLECVTLMRHIQIRFMEAPTATEHQAFAAAQLLITINYNYVLKAMPGLPADPDVRHLMIARILILSLQE